MTRELEKAFHAVNSALLNLAERKGFEEISITLYPKAPCNRIRISAGEYDPAGYNDMARLDYCGCLLHAYESLNKP
jgi:hypothetical protein